MDKFTIDTTDLIYEFQLDEKKICLIIFVTHKQELHEWKCILATNLHADNLLLKPYMIFNLLKNLRENKLHEIHKIEIPNKMENPETELKLNIIIGIPNIDKKYNYSLTISPKLIEKKQVISYYK